jgi:hypothetical protein
MNGPFGSIGTASEYYASKARLQRESIRTRLFEAEIDGITRDKLE